MDILGDPRLLARGGNRYARMWGCINEVFSSVNARPRLGDLFSSGNALPKKVEQVGKGNKNSGDIYGSEVQGPGMSLAVRDITQERDLFDLHRCVVPTTK